MSNFDTGITLRSQEFVQRGQMQSQALRQDSANQMTGGLRDIQQFMQQFALMKAESDAKVQLHEQEMQINAVKLQHMQALDATDLMGEQVRSAKLANDGAEFQLKQQQKIAGQWEKSGMTEVSANIIKAMGGVENMEEAGIAVDPTSGQMRILSPEEREGVAKRRRARNVDPVKLAEQLSMEGDRTGAYRVLQKAGSSIGVEGLTPPAKTAAQPATVPVDPAIQQQFGPQMLSLSKIADTPQKQAAIVQTAWDRKSVV